MKNYLENVKTDNIYRILHSYKDIFYHL